MRRPFLLAAALIAAATTVSFQPAFAQRGGGQPDEQDQADAKKKKQQSEEWGDNQAPLPALRNAGPCPFVKVLYDAARYVEFDGGREASAAVGYTGEIQGVSAGCAYKDAEPIRVKMQILFELGKGPTAQGEAKTYRYWVAVTKRNEMVIDKQYFDLPVKFPAGQSRVMAEETLDEVLIPRATMTTSGANFEILVGFDVTPQMAAFNRDGKRFRVTAGQDVAAGASNPTK
ncbi:MAG: Tat pathway signal sequence domain protein [Phenylobacterium sp.]